jgi:hypothetical protein
MFTISKTPSHISVMLKHVRTHAFQAADEYSKNSLKKGGWGIVINDPRSYILKRDACLYM